MSRCNALDTLESSGNKIMTNGPTVRKLCVWGGGIDPRRQISRFFSFLAASLLPS